MQMILVGAVGRFMCLAVGSACLSKHLAGHASNENLLWIGVLGFSMWAALWGLQSSINKLVKE